MAKLFFGILPLASGFDNLIYYPYDLSEWADNTKAMGWFTFLNNNEGVLEDMKRVIAERVIPVFIKAADCESAYQALSEYEASTFWGKEKPMFYLPFVNYYFCLKYGDYDLAYRHMLDLKPRNMRPADIHFDELFERLQARDETYIRQLLMQNEAKSLETLAGATGLRQLPFR
jgi:hypothetical protein